LMEMESKNRQVWIQMKRGINNGCSSVFNIFFIYTGPGFLSNVIYA
jgi:hypothetical protein